MKNPHVYLAVAAIVAVLGCSKDSPTGPQDDDSYVLEKTQTVGGAGGVIEVDDFSLIIPAGTFAGDYTVKLYASSEAQPFDQNQVTRSFRLEGLPAEYSQPLRVSIKYEGSLSGETCIARGGRFLDFVHGDTVMVYDLHQASDSSGYLVGEIPASQEGSSRLSDGTHLPGGTANGVAGILEMLGLKGHGTRETEHFTIHYPQDLVTVSIPSVGAMLEETYAAITSDMQLPWLWVSRTHVVIKDIGAGRGAYCGLFSGPAGPVLNLSSTYLSDGNFTPVRIDAGKWLMGLVLGTSDQSAVDPANFWLYSAVSSWSEGVFTDDAAYRHPSGFPGEEMAPFNGMRAGAGDGSGAAAIRRAIDHGEGMSAVIKYLTDDPRFTVAGIASTYETIEGTGCSATAALLNNVEALVAEWWPQFFKSYVGGEIYGVGKDVFTASANLSGSWTIATGDDSVKVFTGRYPDLSAKLYLINLSFPAIDESADMLLKLGGQTGYQEPWGVMAFGVGATSLEYWGHSVAQGSTSLQVADLKALYDAGWRQILAVAICSNPSDTYLQTTDADLEVRVIEEQEPVTGDWNAGHLELNSIRGQYLRDYFDPGEEDTEYEYASRNFDSVYFEGSTTGSTFTASWDDTVLTYRYQGSVLAAFVGDLPTMISDLEWTETITTESVTRSYTITMNGVPVTGYWDGGFRAEITGGQTCDFLGSLFHTITYATFQDVLQEWECNAEYPRSSIKIGFWKQ